MIDPDSLAAVAGEIFAFQNEVKEHCLANDPPKSIEWYRGAYAALEELLGRLSDKLRSEDAKVRLAEARSEVLANVDKLRSWMPGEPLLPPE